MVIWKITNSIETAEAFYNLNEDGKGGFFPIGMNNCWHGGIHICTGGNCISTLLSGKLAAYNIPENDADISISEAGNNEVTQRDVKASNGFMLVKHIITMPSVGNNPPKTQDLFLLYMHLAPCSELGLINDYKLVNDVKDDIITLPFYYEWLFRLAPIDAELPDECKYSIRVYENASPSQAVLLQGMLFEISQSDYFHASYNLEETLSVKVLKEPKGEGMNEYKLSKENLNLEGMHDKTIILKQKDKKTSLYNKPAASYENMLINVYGDIEKETVLRATLENNNQNIEGWRKEKNIIEVRVPKGTEITNTGLTKQTAPNVNKFDRITYLAVASEQQNISDVPFKIVRLADYLETEFSLKTYNVYDFEVKTVGKFVRLKRHVDRSQNSYAPAITPDDQYAIVVQDSYRNMIEVDPSDANFFMPSLNHRWEQQSRYVFVADDGKVIPVNFATRGYNSYNSVEQESSSYKLYKINYKASYSALTNTLFTRLDAEKNGFPTIEGTMLIRAKKKLPVDCVFYANAVDFTMEKGPMGQLVLTEGTKTALETPGYLLTEKRGGQTITRDILPSGKEFSIDNDYSFIKTGDSSGIKISKDGCPFRASHPEIPKDLLEVKSDLRAEFKGKPGIQVLDETKQINLPARTVIGYGGQVKDTRQFIHLGMFTKDNLPENVRMPYYILDSRFQGFFYNYEANAGTVGTVYLPKDTRLSVKEPEGISSIGEKPYNNTYVKVGIKELPLYIHNDDLNSIIPESSKTGICKVNSMFNSEIVVFNILQKIFPGNENAATGGDKIKVLQQKLLGDCKALCGKEYEYIDFSNPHYRILIKIEEIAELKEWHFWVRVVRNAQGEITLADRPNCKCENGVFSVLANGIDLNFLDACPNTYQYSQSDFSVNEPRILFEKDVSGGCGISDTDGTRRYEHYKNLASEKIGLGNLAVKEADLEKVKKENIDWNDFFNLHEEDIKNDIICDVGEILGKADRNRDGKVSLNEIKIIYKNRNTEAGMEIVRYFRRSACRFPFEFNKELYGENNFKSRMHELGMDLGESYDQINGLAKQLDIWESIKVIKGLDSAETLLHMNPVHGIEVFDSLNLFEINPYLGKRKQDYLNISFDCVDNPGFAPYIGPDGEHENYNGYSYITNDDVFTKNHPGIDFFAVRLKKTPIHSFISGKIVYSYNRGNSDYGFYLIIQSMANTNHFYLLGHLYPEMPRPNDSFVSPGEIVAYASNTGYCISSNGPISESERIAGWGTHLHLQLIVANDYNDFIDIKDGKLTGIYGKSIHPFNHKITYSSL
jgi:hypothetical protein